RRRPAPAARLILSPPPLRGRVRVGGNGWQALTLGTPHPNPPPQGGREKKIDKGHAGTAAGSSSTLTHPGCRRSNALYASIADVSGSTFVSTSCGSIVPVRTISTSSGTYRRCG